MGLLILTTSLLDMFPFRAKTFLQLAVISILFDLLHAKVSLRPLENGESPPCPKEEASYICTSNWSSLVWDVRTVEDADFYDFNSDDAVNVPKNGTLGTYVLTNTQDGLYTSTATFPVQSPEEDSVLTIKCVAFNEEAKETLTRRDGRPSPVTPKVESIGTGSVCMSWKQDECNNVNHYQVTLRGPLHEKEPVNVTGRAITFENLELATEYTVVLVAVNKFGEGNSTYTDFTTLGAGALLPENLSVHVTWDLSVHFSWQPPEANGSIAPIEWYNIVVSDNGSISHVYVNITVNAGVLQVKLSLDLLKEYVFSVVPIHCFGPGQAASITQSIGWLQITLMIVVSSLFLLILIVLAIICGCVCWRKCYAERKWVTV